MIQEGTRRRQRFSSPSHRLHTNAGLTLIELVIVLALMVLVIGTVYVFFDFVNNSFAKGGDQYLLQSNLRNASDFVIKEVRNATELEFVTVPFTEDASFQYIYVESNVLKHKYAGTATDKSENIITGAELFSVREEHTTGRYYFSINMKGSINGEDYTLNTEILLNNISSMTEPLSGNAIRYKK